MKKNILNGVSITIGLLFLFSCANNKEELPEPEQAQTFTGPTITYTNNTKQIFDNYCITCHAPGFTQANFPLTTYNEVSVYSNPGGLIETRVLNFGNMPPTGSSAGQLTLAEKDTLQMWINQGAPL